MTGWDLERAARYSPPPQPVSLIGKVLLGSFALLVTALSYPALWWRDRHVRHRLQNGVTR